MSPIHLVERTGDPRRGSPVAHFYHSVKIVLSILISTVVLLVCSCSDRDSSKLLGTWQTDVIQSEWGSNRVTVTYFKDGRIVGTNDFVDDDAIGWSGTYRVRNGIIDRTIAGDTSQV